MWPRHTFSSQYQYSIKQTSGENVKKYQAEDYHLIQYLILRTKTISYVWQTVIFFLHAIHKTLLETKQSNMKTLIFNSQ